MQVNGGTDRITPGNRLEDIYEPDLWRVVPYLLCVCLIGEHALSFRMWSSPAPVSEAEQLPVRGPE